MVASEIEIHTVDEVAEIFRRSRRTVLRRVRSGVWPALREGRDIFFGPEQIKIIRDLMDPAPAAKPMTDREKFKANLAGARHL